MVAPCPDGRVQALHLIRKARLSSGIARAIEKEIDGGNPAVPGDDEISPRVCRLLAGRTRRPLDPPGIAQLLWRGDRLILKVGMSSLDHACDAVDFVAATVGAA